MERTISPEMIGPFVVSNAVSLLILWFSFRNIRVAKGILGLLFVLAGIFNIYTVFSNPSAYLSFADTSILPLYEKFIRGPFADYSVIVISIISMLQFYIGFSMMYDDWRFKSACIGGIIFGLAIAPLGVGSAFPSSVILSISFLVILILTRRDEKLNSH